MPEEECSNLYPKFSSPYPESEFTPDELAAFLPEALIAAQLSNEAYYLSNKPAGIDRWYLYKSSWSTPDQAIIAKSNDEKCYAGFCGTLADFKKRPVESALDWASNLFPGTQHLWTVRMLHRPSCMGGCPICKKNGGDDDGGGDCDDDDDDCKETPRSLDDLNHRS